MERIPEGKKARADTPGGVASVANTGLSDVFALGLYTNREPLDVDGVFDAEDVNRGDGSGDKRASTSRNGLGGLAGSGVKPFGAKRELSNVEENYWSFGGGGRKRGRL
jgi:hypothetical protein